MWNKTKKFKFTVLTKFFNNKKTLQTTRERRTGRNAPQHHAGGIQWQQRGGGTPQNGGTGNQIAQVCVKIEIEFFKLK